MKKMTICALLAAAVALPAVARAEVDELRIPLGAGGFGFLPLHMMNKHKLIERFSNAAVRGSKAAALACIERGGDASRGTRRGT